MTNSKRTCLAADVGGTNIKVGLVDEDGRVLARQGFPTASGRGPDMVMADIIRHLKGLAAEAPKGRRPMGLAIGVPGWINQADGVLLKAPNMPGWVNVPVVEIMSRAFDLPVLLENDSNLYALGEWHGGAGRGLKHLLVITLGTGVGGGLIIEGKLWYGAFASAGEIGHQLVELRGAPCGCGGRGCLETIASATGMTRLGREWLKKKKETLYRGEPDRLTPEMMFDLARRGDPMSLAVFRRAGEALGMVLVGVFNLLGLEGVIIGGGVAGAFEFIRPRLLEIMNRGLVVADPARLKLVRGELGEDAPLAGAPALLRALAG
ncbi:MAG: ROK family protein [Candidatus Adiutrix sp.]|jgi:glucokinase|nr:ROK family protein [Candidatus Adiutrix sp.]